MHSYTAHCVCFFLVITFNVKNRIIIRSIHACRLRNGCATPTIKDSSYSGSKSLNFIKSLRGNNISTSELVTEFCIISNDFCHFYNLIISFIFNEFINVVVLFSLLNLSIFPLSKRNRLVKVNLNPFFTYVYLVRCKVKYRRIASINHYRSKDIVPSVSKRICPFGLTESLGVYEAQCTGNFKSMLFNGFIDFYKIALGKVLCTKVLIFCKHIKNEV